MSYDTQHIPTYRTLCHLDIAWNILDIEISLGSAYNPLGTQNSSPRIFLHLQDSFLQIRETEYSGSSYCDSLKSLLSRMLVSAAALFVIRVLHKMMATSAPVCILSFNPEMVVRM